MAVPAVMRSNDRITAIFKRFSICLSTFCGSRIEFRSHASLLVKKMKKDCRTIGSLLNGAQVAPYECFPCLLGALTGLSSTLTKIGLE